MAEQSASHAGQAVYTPATLAAYDLLVLGLSNRLVWRCPTSRLLALYDRHVTNDHLDVGVGTGWYLDRCRFPSSDPRIALLDLNASSLEAAARRIARYRPLTVRADVLTPLSIDTPPFASVSLTYLLHCLPGAMVAKAVALDHLARLMRPDGILFGATLLSRGVNRSWAARRLMHAYNARGIFSNAHDGLDELQAALHARFAEVEIEVVGCGALFSARQPRAA